MAKPKKRIPTRKKSSKRGKASAKPSRKKVAKRSPLKKSKSKAQRARSAPKPAAKKKRQLKTARRKTPNKTPQVMEAPVETTIIDVIEEPAPGVVVVTEYELVRTETPISPAGSTGPETEKQ
jgi:hypothetical protein